MEAIIQEPPSWYSLMPKFETQKSVYSPLGYHSSRLGMRHAVDLCLGLGWPCQSLDLGLDSQHPAQDLELLLMASARPGLWPGLDWDLWTAALHQLGCRESRSGFGLVALGRPPCPQLACSGPCRAQARVNFFPKCIQIIAHTALIPAYSANCLTVATHTAPAGKLSLHTALILPKIGTYSADPNIQR